MLKKKHKVIYPSNEINAFTIWGKCRNKMINYYGEIGYALDNAWFSKLIAKEDKDAKMLNIIAPNESFKNMIESRYRHLIEKILREDGYKTRLTWK